MAKGPHEDRPKPDGRQHRDHKSNSSLHYSYGTCPIPINKDKDLFSSLPPKTLGTETVHHRTWNSELSCFLQNWGETLHLTNSKAQRSQQKEAM
ncbi:hypothetical protein I79_019942 [Cricetulus griseus]|uniref:Uncharacterized protein n=1 Tax=Cricetulus griseus TaxID=10029 RepID=G3I8R6_CRIGR|nr:hypothetical protein I79_019942 [Cricetulus griseus]